MIQEKSYEGEKVMKINDRTTEQIANVYEEISNEILLLRNKQDLLKEELERRMGDDEALACEGFNIQKKITKWVYNDDFMTGKLKELITPNEWDSLTKVVPESKSWNGTKIYALGRKYKGKVQDAIDESRSAINYRLEIKKEGGQ